MGHDRAQHLAELAQRRSDDAHARVHDAIRQLDQARQPVTFASVPQAASVSRAWLYRIGELRSEIERLRRQRPTSASPLPAAQRATVQSYQRRIEALLDANRELREENRRLNERLAEVLGQRPRHVTDHGSLDSQAPPPERSR